jgi:His/Glu/Gln/Arg/opine family amino acid ABC transporter permease subunit
VTGVLTDFGPYLLQAAAMTVVLAAACILLSTAIGFLGGMLSVVAGPIIRLGVKAYVYVIRGTPILVQVFLVYFGLPFLGIRVSSYVVAIIAISLHMSAYVIEIVRGAIVAIPAGQTDAALALGMRPWLLLRQVLLPQALIAAMPPYVSLLPVTVKATALASVINIWELTFAAREIANKTLATFEVFGVVFGLYFVMCYPLSYLGSRVERRLVEYRQRPGTA